MTELQVFVEFMICISLCIKYNEQSQMFPEAPIEVGFIRILTLVIISLYLLIEKKCMMGFYKRKLLVTQALNVNVCFCEEKKNTLLSNTATHQLTIWGLHGCPISNQTSPVRFYKNISQTSLLLDNIEIDRQIIGGSKGGGMAPQRPEKNERIAQIATFSIIEIKNFPRGMLTLAPSNPNVWSYL